MLLAVTVPSKTDISKGHDAVWIENPTEWGLPEGIVAPYDHPNTPDPKPQNFYVISILHQLHCLVRSSALRNDEI
jgi:hypothetical protein